jgi:hypothetical protein
MAGILRIAFAVLLVGTIATAPAFAGVPVTPVPLSEPADESAGEPLDRGQRAVAAERPPIAGRRQAPPTRPVPMARPTVPAAGPFDLSVPLHVRFCVWRE